VTVVAIDGPAGSGKSTIARALAARLGVPHVDTGAYYRAATLAVLRAGADPHDAQACAHVVAGVRIERRADRTLLDGVDVEAEIRGPAVTAAVSAVSAHPQVRRELLDRQRAAVSAAGAVVEGRDAGTVVVPDAAVKVWLTASPRERARRRAHQLGEDRPAAVAAHEAEIARRDTRDAARMTPAPDAVSVDSSDREAASVVGQVARLVAERARRGKEQR
jgi:cytidylate kinase